MNKKNNLLVMLQLKERFTMLMKDENMLETVYKRNKKVRRRRGLGQCYNSLAQYSKQKSMPCHAKERGNCIPMKKNICRNSKH